MSKHFTQEALGLSSEPPLDAPSLAAAALAEGRPAADAALALEVFAAAGPRFTDSYRRLLLMLTFDIAVSWSKTVQRSRWRFSSPPGRASPTPTGVFVIKHALC